MCTILAPALERDRLHREMRQRTVADRGEIVLARIALQQLDQIGDGVDPHTRVDHQRAGLRDQLRDRRDILLRIVGQLGEQQRVDRERPADADADGGAVGRGLGDRVGADIAARARLVLDDEGRCPHVSGREPVGDHARDDVGRGAGAERHDDVHRFRRPGLRGSCAGRRKQTGKRANEARLPGAQRLLAAFTMTRPPSATKEGAIGP